MKHMGNFLHSPLSRVVVVVGLCLLIWTCGDDKIVTPPDDTPQPLKYKNDSELLALYTAGTLRPQEWLARKIDHELDLIRSTWGDSIPDVNMPFQAPWASRGITVRVDQQLLDEIKAGSNEEWNSLIKDLNLNVHFYNFSFNLRYLGLIAIDNMLPIRIAEYFVAFPGIEYIHAGGNLADWDDFFTRVITATSAKYYFKHNTCPDIWNAYTYVEIKNDSAILVGNHHECFESMVQSPTWVSYERFEIMIDSLEANRAAWVDTARQEIWDFYRFPGFQWSRNSL